MNDASKAMAAIAVCLTLISSGCSTTELRRAAAATGRIDAGLTIGDLPADCRKREPHAPVVRGAEVRSVLKRERAALDRANDRVVRCAAYHDDLVDHLENQE